MPGAKTPSTYERWAQYAQTLDDSDEEEAKNKMDKFRNGLEALVPPKDGPHKPPVVPLAAYAAPPAAAPPAAPPAAAARLPPAEAAGLVDRLMKAERLGEEVLTERQQMIELDRRRNANREALGSLRRTEKRIGAEAAAAQKHWVCMGDTFLKHKDASARQLLEADQKRIEAELEELRQSVKRKSSQLCELDPSIADGSDIHRSFVSLHGVSAAELEQQMGAVGSR